MHAPVAHKDAVGDLVGNRCIRSPEAADDTEFDAPEVHHIAVPHAKQPGVFNEIAGHDAAPRPTPGDLPGSPTRPGYGTGFEGIGAFTAEFLQLDHVVVHQVGGGVDQKRRSGAQCRDEVAVASLATVKFLLINHSVSYLRSLAENRRGNGQRI